MFPLTILSITATSGCNITLSSFQWSISGIFHRTQMLIFFQAKIKILNQFCQNNFHFNLGEILPNAISWPKAKRKIVVSSDAL